MVEEDVVATFTVGPTQPPAFVPGMEYWERSSDPWHKSAFSGTELAGFGSAGLRREGWMAIEWTENPVGFIPDGTVCNGKAPEFEIFDDANATPNGHPIAVRVFKDWHEAACCVRHEGVYVELDANPIALLEEVKRQDVKFLLVSRGFWNANFDVFDQLLEHASQEKVLEGYAGKLEGIPVFTDAFEGRRQFFRRIRTDGLFSVRVATEKHCTDIKKYPLLHGVRT